MKPIATLFIFLISSLGMAQDDNTLGNPLAAISLENPDLVAIDTKDQIFISNSSGDIYLYAKEGEQLNLFSPSRQGKLDQLEAAWTVNIFSFSADLQQYRILDRFLNPLAEQGFLGTEVNLAKAATLGNNNVVWVWDESDLSLKKVDFLRNIVTESQPLNLILDSSDLSISEIREFKNRLFVNVPKSGVYIFDNQANLMGKLNLSGVSKLCYYQEHLLWIQDNELKAMDLGTQSISTLAKVAEPKAQYIQIGQEILSIVTSEKVYVYQIPDWLKAIE
ncbi:hypothetical protein PBT90_13025 [Algoriphagus halophytocola]|uniref:hypothetical protein n=1 Tax=Algoriphagus halophytocola TaxID=2991499 RepID=UPI0022DE91E0|nr:hypothetical protein [Algoriphagus sp. TR-M9]WBL41677.1 hypothetical protein PBT90_13025 [Algoriphagus sp. TR-M9]